MHHSTLEARRERERRKYQTLSGKRFLLLGGRQYGASNHGRGALCTVARWRPRFVVDFGCGSNAFISALRKRGLSGIGIDFANRKADICAPMHDVPLDAGIADVITCFDALEHLLPEDVEPVLHEMRRIATPPSHNGQAHYSRFIFSICTRPSRIRINGENLHPTVKPIRWWLRRISRVAKITRADRTYIHGEWR